MSDTLRPPPASGASSAAGLLGQVLANTQDRQTAAQALADAINRTQQSSDRALRERVSSAQSRAAADHVRERLRSSMDGARASQLARRGVPALRRAFPNMPLAQIAELLRELSKGLGDEVLPRFAYGFRLTGRCSAPNGPVNGFRATGGGPLADGLAIGCSTYTPLPPGSFDFSTVSGFLGEYFVPGDYAQAVESWTRTLPSGEGGMPVSVPVHPGDGEGQDDYPYPRFGMQFASASMGLGPFTAPAGDPHPDQAPHRLQQAFERALAEAAAARGLLDADSDLSVTVRETPAPAPDLSTPNNPWDNPWFNEVRLNGDIQVGSGGASIVPPSFQYSRPPAGVREKKLKVNTRLAPFLIINALTESIDFTKAIWEALPAKYRKAKGTRIDYMLADLWRHWDKIDWREAAYNLVENTVEDNLIGRVNRYANSRTEDIFGRTGIQGGASRVNYALGNTPFNDEGSGVDQFKLLTIAQARLKLALGVERDPRDRAKLERIARGDFSAPRR